MKAEKASDLVGLDQQSGTQEVVSEHVTESKRDLILIERVLRGDKDAYRQIVEKYQQRAFLLALEVVKSREDAEDVVQESFVKAFLSLPDFKRQSAFYTWLYRIVYNMAVDHRRKKMRQGGDKLSYDESAATRNDLGIEEKGVLHVKESELPKPDEVLARKQDAERINRAFAEISEEHRVVMLLREVDGLSYDEIAEATGTAKGTVMSRLFYARKKLQEVLSRE